MLRTVEVLKYEAGEKPGYVKVCGIKSREQIAREVTQSLQEDEAWKERLGGLDYLSGSHHLDREGSLPTSYWGVVVFPVVGGSEGHYIHAGILDREFKYHEIMLGKTFNGMEEAEHMAHGIREILSGD